MKRWQQRMTKKEKTGYSCKENSHTIVTAITVGRQNQR